MADVPLPTQPDQRSCGATVLVMARVLTDPEYAARVAAPEAFRAEVLAVHGRATSAVDAAGRIQLPWPRLLGTPPWAVAHHLSATTGTTYRVRPARWHRAVAFDRVVTAVTAGHPVPVYVGSAWLPRHVVLAQGTRDGALRVYEPAGGHLADVTREAFVAGSLGLAGWDRPWFAVLP
ncbi:MAG TPA: hypothetical protein VFT00_07660 [Nocardioides sp.]|nr:hypothetical protein [Nocardioides sp.]